MNDQQRTKHLSTALKVVGFIMIFGIWPLTILWPSGWNWHGEGRSYYLEMILVVYATLGVFLIYIARDPLKHLSLIWFTIVSNITHGGIMVVHSFDKAHNMGHMVGDVPALFLISFVLWVLLPKNSRFIEVLK